MSSLVPDYINVRVVIVDPRTNRVATLRAQDDELPSASIATNTRIAESLTFNLLERYGLYTLQLAVMPPDERTTWHCAVHELLPSPESDLGQFRFVSPNTVSELTVRPRLLSTIHQICEGGATSLGKFARTGWIHELFHRLGYSSARRGLPVVRQFNQGIDFSLVSLSNDGTRKWFKAVGSPNTKEYALTHVLAAHLPEFLPNLLLSIPEWNGWVSIGVNGEPLYKSQDYRDWFSATRALATMQRRLVGSSSALYGAGAEDWTTGRMRSLLNPFFLEVRRAMEAQTCEVPPALTSSQLDELQSEIEETLLSLEDCGIPDTIIHGDIGHGNVLVSSSETTFLDWCETYVGHPFICFEHLMADLKRCHPHLVRYQSALRDYYCGQWTNEASDGALTLARQLMPAVAALMAGFVSWSFYADHPAIDRIWPYLRTTVRRAQSELIVSKGVLQ